MPKKPNRPRGRPVIRKMPEQIPDTPENVAKIIMLGPPKKTWDYLKGKGNPSGFSPSL